MFFKAQSQFFFGISKKKFIQHNRYFQNDHWKIFFSKKNLSKKFANEIGKKNLWKKNWKSTFFYQKYFLMVILKVTIMVNKFFFFFFKKKLRSGLIEHSSGPFLTWLGSFSEEVSNFIYSLPIIKLLKFDFSYTLM